MLDHARRGHRRGAVHARRQVADVAKARVLTDGGGPRAAELQPVVLRRVVAGGEHRPRQREPARGEVDQVGRGEPDVDHARALGRDPRDERLGERGRRQPAVAAQDDALGTRSIWRRRGRSGGPHLRRTVRGRSRERRRP